MAKQPVYTVVDGPLDHDGKRFHNGDFVELDAKLGERLAGDGIVASGKVELPAGGDDGEQPQG